MPTPTLRYVNILATSFTPSGGSLTLIKGVQSANLDYNPDLVRDGGDGDLYDTIKALVKMDPMIAIEFINAQALAAITPGATGSFTFTIGDAKNQGVAAGGGVIFTVSNAIYLPRTLANSYRGLSKFSAVFETYSTDGTTSPIAFAAA